jgi:DNA-binding transcriptional LysR family regulator
MEPYLLRYFLAVVETGSFTKAAGACLITQPSLSAGIKRLEDQLGVSLFVRNNKRVFLTTAGTRFLPRAKTILNECNMAMAEVSTRQQIKVLRLGVVQTLPSARLSGLIKAFAQQGFDGRFELFEGSEQEIQNRFDERGIDYGLSIWRGEDSLSVPLFDEPYLLCLSKDHPLASEREIRGEALLDQPMIVRTRCEILSETSRYFTDRNVRPPLVYRTQNDERALEMVAANMGATVMPQSYLRPDIAGISLQGFTLRRTLALLKPPQGLRPPLSDMGHEFEGFCKTYFSP